VFAGVFPLKSTNKYPERTDNLKPRRVDPQKSPADIKHLNAGIIFTPSGAEKRLSI